MNTELMEALKVLEEEKNISKRHDAGCNRKFSDQCM